jgi:WD40 repeat protein
VSEYDIFLSFSSADRPTVEALDGRLRQLGVRPFLDRHELRPGLPWIAAIEDAMNRSLAAAIVVGPHGFGNVQQYERDLAVVRQSRDREFPVIPVLLPGCETPPTGFLELLTWIDLREGYERPGALEGLMAAARRQPTPSAGLRSTICPYMGLEPFREEDAPFYCGRDAAIADLVARVREHSFVAVVGRSGSGKSSLVFAGLLPALRRQRPGVVWDALSLRPGAWPLRELAKAFEPQSSGMGAIVREKSIDDAVEALRGGQPEMLSHVVATRLDGAPEKPDRLLLYVDQWEELYAMAPPAEHAEPAKRHAEDVEAFVTLLSTLASDPRSRATVVLTVRADFYGPLMRHLALARILPHQQVNIGPLTREDVRAAITTPSKKAGLKFEPPTLVDEILDDAGTDEAMLPLLQYALKETWRRRREDALTASGYTEAGGVGRAIQVTADRTYAALTDPEKAIARRLFLGLVTPGEGREDTRARIEMPSDPAVRQVIAKFTDRRARLLVTGSEAVSTSRGKNAVGDVEPDREERIRPTLEVAHEALIRTWPELRGWLDASREMLRSRAAIVQQRKEWESNGRRPDLLLSPGFQIERGRALLAGAGDVPVEDLRDYIDLSQKQETERIAVERDAELRERRRLRWLTIAAVAVAVTFGALAIYAVEQTRAARTATSRATDAEHVAKEQAERARESLAMALYQKGRSAEEQQRWNVATMYFAAARVQHDTQEARWAAGLAEARAIVPSVRYLEHAGEVNAVAIAPDGERVVTVDGAGGVRVWSRGDGTTLAAAELRKGLWAVAFAPDGNELAIGDEDGLIRRMTPELKLLQELPGHTKQIWSLTYSPDGETLASASEDKTIRLWPRRGGPSRELKGHTQRVYSVAFSRDGSKLASGSDDRQMWLWNPANGIGRQYGASPSGGIRAVAFVNDSVVGGTWGNEVRTWDARAPVAKLQANWAETGPVHALVVTPDARVIATAGDTGNLRFWDTTTRHLIAALELPGGRVPALAVSRDGRWLVSAGQNRESVVWDLTALPRLLDAVGHMEEAHVELSSDREQIVSASADHTLRVWDRRTGAQRRALSLGDAICTNAVALLRDGTILAACDDLALRRWSADGRESTTPTGIWMPYGSYSPNERTLVGGHLNGLVGTLDLSTNALGPVRKLHEHHIYKIGYSRDGTRIFTAALDGKLRVWTPQLTLIADFAAGKRDGLVSGALSPDATVAVSGSDDGFVDAWNVATRAHLGHIPAHDGMVMSIAHTGRLIYSSGADGLVNAWDATTWSLAQKYDAGEGRASSLVVSDDGAQLLVGYGSGAIVAWDTATGRPQWRTGGRSREHGSCDDLSAQTWVDDAHRKIVATACSSEAAAYFDAYAKRSHQRLEHDIDVKTSWSTGVDAGP